MLPTGKPADVIEALGVQVWRKQVSKATLADCEARHTALSTRQVAGNPAIHEFSGELPEEGFDQIAPDLEDVRVQEAMAKRRADGRYKVNLTLHGSKNHADGTGKKTPATLDDRVEVGVSARGKSGEDRDEKVPYLQRHRITSGEPKVMGVDELPYEAGLDPATS